MAAAAAAAFPLGPFAPAVATAGFGPSGCFWSDASIGTAGAAAVAVAVADAAAEADAEAVALVSLCSLASSASRLRTGAKYGCAIASLAVKRCAWSNTSSLS